MIIKSSFVKNIEHIQFHLTFSNLKKKEKRKGQQMLKELSKVACVSLLVFALVVVFC